MKYIYIINDFAHDLFTGLWLSSLAAIYLIRLKTGGVSSGEWQLVSELSGDFLWMQNIALGLIILTGVGRYLHQKTRTADKHTNHHQARRQVLIIKHIIMGILFTSGTALGFAWRLH
ncbi:MAG TPA: hypothetical protein ENK33_04110 [Desulfobacterales bacterium]|nr:hypothetical protein [Desulfobacterales bacterium]